MEQPLTYLRQLDDHWLIGHDSHKFKDLTEQLFQNLTQYQDGVLPKILLVEPDPVKFLSGFVAACAANCPVFLGNPHWVKNEWQQVFDLVQPDLIWGPCSSFRRNQMIPQSQKPGAAGKGWIMVPTGGSSGKIRFAIHTWETLMASVQGFRQYFQLTQVNSFCVLPLYHVSGLMQFIRCFTSSGQLVILPFNGGTMPASSLQESAEACHVDPTKFFLSLVPTQLQRLLERQDAAGPASSWLSRFQTVLLGGAPAWPELLEKARHHRIRLAPTYGMTETASQIATLKPDAFLDGNRTCGHILPHATVAIYSPTGELLGSNQTGVVTIKTAALALGYYPVGDRVSPQRDDTKDVAASQSLPFATLKYFQADDLGFFDSQGYLNIVGRRSHKIITGGENVFPAEVELAIRATNLVADVCVVGASDQHWGQVIIAIYVPSHPKLSTSTLQTAITDRLSKFKRPKYWISVNSLPRNSQGKLNTEQLQQIVTAWQQYHTTG